VSSVFFSMPPWLKELASVDINGYYFRVAEGVDEE
jgi:hypothetical protein